MCDICLCMYICDSANVCVCVCVRPGHHSTIYNRENEKLHQEMDDLKRRHSRQQFILNKVHLQSFQSF